MGLVDVFIKVGGSIAIALALFAFLALSTGVAFNQIIPGLGNILIIFGVISILILIIAFVVIIATSR